MSKKETGRKWDGRSRVSNEVYRKRYDEIFGKKKVNNEKRAIDINTLVVDRSRTTAYDL